MKIFRLIQKEDGLWDIISPKNIPVVSNIRFYKEIQALEFCRAYVSSWNNAVFKVEYLEQGPISSVI